MYPEYRFDGAPVRRVKGKKIDEAVTIKNSEIAKHLRYASTGNQASARSWCFEVSPRVEPKFMYAVVSINIVVNQSMVPSS